jgi:hypothetical protein
VERMFNINASLMKLVTGLEYTQLDDILGRKIENIIHNTDTSTR